VSTVHKKLGGKSLTQWPQGGCDDGLGTREIRLHVEVTYAGGSILERPVTMAANSNTSVVRWAVGVRREASPGALTEWGKAGSTGNKKDDIDSLAARGIGDVEVALTTALLASWAEWRTSNGRPHILMITAAVDGQLWVECILLWCTDLWDVGRGKMLTVSLNLIY
jgi:hypothetical protein